MTLRIGSFVELGTVRGEPMVVAGHQLVPVARSLSVAVGKRGGPMAGGFTWARPLAVEVIEPTGLRRLSIPNTTMRLLFGLVAAQGLLVLLLRLLKRRSRSKTDQGGSEDEPTS